MTLPDPGQPMQIANPLQWQIAHGRAPDGTPLCLLQLSQGALQVTLQVTVPDMEQLSRGLLDTLAQARTGLIIPTGALASTMNGHGGS